MIFLDTDSNFGFKRRYYHHYGASKNNVDHKKTSLHISSVMVSSIIKPTKMGDNNKEFMEKSPNLWLYFGIKLHFL